MIPYWGHARPELSHLWYDDGALLWGGNVEDADGTDGDSLTRAELESRTQWRSELDFLRKYIPGFERSRVENSPGVIGIRETRHIEGEYVYTMQDCKEDRKFPDTVAYFEHGHHVPYRCLVPKGIDNLLLSSRCLSVEPGEIGMGPKRGVYSNSRSIVSTMSCAQASGTAAALCAGTGVVPRALNVATLQKALTDQGALVAQEYIEELRKKRPNRPFMLFGQEDTFWAPVGGTLKE
jgi:hypothetical protein